MLDTAQRYTHAIDWKSMETAQAMLQATNAFTEGDLANSKFPRAEGRRAHVEVARSCL